MRPLPIVVIGITAMTSTPLSAEISITAVPTTIVTVHATLTATQTTEQTRQDIPHLLQPQDFSVIQNNRRRTVFMNVMSGIEIGTGLVVMLRRPVPRQLSYRCYSEFRWMNPLVRALDHTRPKIEVVMREEAILVVVLKAAEEDGDLMVREVGMRVVEDLARGKTEIVDRGVGTPRECLSCLLAKVTIWPAM
jgi:hypothetical protein